MLQNLEYVARIIKDEGQLGILYAAVSRGVEAIREDLIGGNFAQRHWNRHSTSEEGRQELRERIHNEVDEKIREEFDRKLSVDGNFLTEDIRREVVELFSSSFWDALDTSGGAGRYGEARNCVEAMVGVSEEERQKSVFAAVEVANQKVVDFLAGKAREAENSSRFAELSGEKEKLVLKNQELSERVQFVPNVEKAVGRLRGALSFVTRSALALSVESDGDNSPALADNCIAVREALGKVIESLDLQPVVQSEDAGGRRKVLAVVTGFCDSLKDIIEIGLAGSESTAYHDQKCRVERLNQEIKRDLGDNFLLDLQERLTGLGERADQALAGSFSRFSGPLARVLAGVSAELDSVVDSRSLNRDAQLNKLSSLTDKLAKCSPHFSTLGNNCAKIVKSKAEDPDGPVAKIRAEVEEVAKLVKQAKLESRLQSEIEGATTAIESFLKTD